MKIELIASDFETTECEIAIGLKAKFEEWLINRSNKKDKIFIAPNMRVFGEHTRDIDIFIFGVLDTEVSLKLDFFDEKKNRVNKNVYINSFCFAIDIREEQYNSIKKEDGDIWISTNGRKANFSKYNKELYFVLRKYMKNVLIKIIIFHL